MFRVEQFDGPQAHFLPGLAQVVKGDVLVTPFADGMVDVSLESARGISGGQTRVQ